MDSLVNLNFLELVMEMDHDFIKNGQEFLDPTKAELKEFTKKFNLIPLEILQKCLKVEPEMFMVTLNRMVPCVGCRRSVEILYQNATDCAYRAFHPFDVDENGTWRLMKEKLRAKYVCSLFHCQNPKGKVQALLDSLAKCKPGRRCTMHSLDSRVRSVSSWIEIWESMDSECQDELGVIEMSYLKETMMRYLHKHRFCEECKAKVYRAYQILVGEVDGKSEIGYISSVYNGITCLSDVSLQLSSTTDFVSFLIAKAVPEMGGMYVCNPKEKHAKTMQVAQEEVMTCIGICLFDRLNRIQQRFREEERTWQIIICTGIRALRWQFEKLIELKLGVSQLELFCEELSKEEELKQQKIESKKQRRRRKKEKKIEECVQEDNLKPVDSPVEKEEEILEECKAEKEEDMQNSDSHNSQEKPSAIPLNVKNQKKKSKGKTLNESNPITATIKNSQSVQSSQTAKGLKETPIDCGYSSEHIVDMPSCGSSCGSEIACSEGFCSHNIGDCSTSSVSSAARGKASPCSSRPRSTSFYYPLPYRSLEEQLEDNYYLDEDDEPVCIPEEEVSLVKTAQWGEKREEFRRRLLMDYNKMSGILCNPSSTQQEKHCSHSKGQSDFNYSNEVDENAPPVDSNDGNENKTGSKSQLSKSKSRAGAGQQASRRYKGKNRR